MVACFFWLKTFSLASSWQQEISPGGKKSNEGTLYAPKEGKKKDLF